MADGSGRGGGSGRAMRDGPEVVEAKRLPKVTNFPEQAVDQRVR
jgi:hypothetical protein